MYVRIALLGLCVSMFFAKTTCAQTFFFGFKADPDYSKVSNLSTGGASLKLNAAENMPDALSWEWSGPENFQSYNPQVGYYKTRIVHTALQ